MEIDACLDSNLPLKDTELSSLLTNLLNNAIEGSRQVEDPRIWVHIYPTRAYLCVSIQNKADVTALGGTIGVNENENVFRKDEIKIFENQNGLLENAPDQELNMFKIPKVIQ